MTDIDISALVNAADPGPEVSIYDRTRATVSDALDEARARLISLRGQRKAINDEIRTLVTEVELLERMARIEKGSRG